MNNYKDVEKNNVDGTQLTIANDIDNNFDNGRDDGIPVLNKVKVPFFKSTVFQMIIISVIAFSGPAQSDAINGLGGGGMASADLWNLAEALFYAIMFVVTLFGGPIVSKLGLKTTLVIGSITFPLEGIALYVVSRWAKAGPFLVVAEAIAGIGSGCFYIAEAGLVLSLPETNKRGAMLAIWIVGRNLGQLVGGAINLALNSQTSSSGSVNPNIYFVFIAIECLGLPAALLIKHPEQVQRKDGTVIRAGDKLPLKQELNMLLNGTVLTPIIGLIAMFSFYSFFYISPYGTYLTEFFSVRARALSSLISPTLCIIACFGLGFLLDMQSLNQRYRAYLGFIVVCSCCIGTYIWTLVVLSDLTRTPNVSIDWSSSDYPRSFLPYFFIQSAGPMQQSFCYWLISSFGSDVQSNTRMGGVFRAIEAAGQAVSYGLMSADNVPLWAGFGANFGLLLVSVFPMVFTLRSVPKEGQTIAMSQDEVVAHNENTDDAREKDKVIVK
ncbi:hypothetical protein E3Q22_00529 [Wallemia mellicola]|uniref:MFS general substrate transporter n=1 Tax=Wallemia mellicola TaxID=1708541 RepID=A0A4T0MG36_9BASI|nr:hypothetical protein E3Q22_00529 [Wallemia mellicola]